MAFTVNDVPDKENYDEWKKAIKEQELVVADLDAKNKEALQEWLDHRGVENEKEYVDKYNKLQCEFILAKQKLGALRRGT